MFTTGMHPVLFGGLNNAILVLLLGIFLVWDRKKFFLNNKMMLWALLLVAIMLSNNQDNKRFGTILVYDTLAYILAWLFYILAVKDSKWHKAFFDVCLSFGLFHALATWFFKFVPSLHSSFIVPLLGTWGSHALREVQIGLAPGIAPTYSTNAIYFFLLYGITGNSLYDFQTLFPYLASCGIVHYYSKYTVNIANELGARTEQ